MPVALILVAIDAVLVVHAIRSGRFVPWGYLMLLLPGIGAVAYVAAELAPEWLGSYKGRQARGRLADTVDPQRRYRQLKDNLADLDTIANRVALAEECLMRERFEEALALYQSVVGLPLGDEPSYVVGLARAQFGLGRFDDTIASLEGMREKWPDYASGDAHLLYARALEAAGRNDEALTEYESVGGYFPGPEPRVRRARLLQRLGRGADAKALADEVARTLRRAPHYVRRNQANWLSEAEKIARS